MTVNAVEESGWHPSAELIRAIGIVESNEDDSAINYEEMAYGRYQIRQCVITDVNNKYKIRAHLNQVLVATKGEQVMRLWWTIYPPKSDEQAARMWNGGPDGHLQIETLKYWDKVKYVKAQLQAKT